MITEAQWRKFPRDIFFFKNTKKNPVDYERIYEALKKGPLSFEQIGELAGVNEGQTYRVITTLSLRYPVWDFKRGWYKLLEDSDFKGDYK